jgi:hypothetical protein
MQLSPNDGYQVFNLGSCGKQALLFGVGGQSTVADRDNG